MTPAQAAYLVGEFGTKYPNVMVARVPAERALQICDNRTGDATIWNGINYLDALDFLKKAKIRHD